ncbi:MAG: glycosyltransferase family 4 protein [Candidatus Micrarchaeota archaeon]|nr:glycosyltransferase family 4 protein [Candidatus Micrarchaeota archaeon]
MRIALFVYEYPPRMVGGLGTYADEITRQYASMGHEVSVFTMNDAGKLKTYENMNGIDVFRPISTDFTKTLPIVLNSELSGWGPGLRFFSDIFTYNVLAAHLCVNRIAKDKKFDIISAHDWLSALAGVTTKENLRIPLVFHMHSSEKGRTMGKGSSTVATLETFAGNSANMTVTVSNFMKNELESIGFPRERINVMYNGVDEDKYNIANYKREQLAEYRASLGLSESDRVILFTGRLTPVKGIDTLIRAMPKISSEVRNAKLVILGTGEMLEELKRQASHANLKEKVIFVDRWVAERERILLYASSDLVCAPSRYEPFGIVPLEAMGLSKPVVVGLGGLKETVVDNESGLHCNPDDPDDIARKCVSIFKDDALAKRLGSGGRKRVEESYTWRKIAHETIKLYEKALK